MSGLNDGYEMNKVDFCYTHEYVCRNIFLVLVFSLKFYFPSVLCTLYIFVMILLSKYDNY